MGYRDLSAEFEDCSDNSINEVNAADASQLPDDPDMPELEDITYYDDENDVGAEADFNNLETYIIVSPIPTTRVHKDHPVSQIIGDLSSTTQTRSMTRVIKDQGGLAQMFDDDLHTCMFACFLSQEDLKRVHQALKDPSWIEAMQEELLQFKMQKTMNYHPVTAGNQTNPSAGFQDKFDAEKTGEEIDQQYVLFLVRSSGSINPQNYDGDATFDGKEHDFDAKKPESEVSVSPS
nr:hypothetical protein [Tanacetum cinerariifolium]